MGRLGRIVAAMLALFVFVVLEPRDGYMSISGLLWMLIMGTLVTIFSSIAEANVRKLEKQEQLRRENVLQVAIDSSILRRSSGNANDSVGSTAYAITYERNEILKPVALGPEEFIDKVIVLYLRPFVADRDLLVINPGNLLDYIIPFYSATRPKVVRIDEVILKTLEGDAALVAIGNRGDEIGAARLVVPDASWKAYFCMLANSAEYIVSVPSLHESTLWELKELAQQKLCDRVMMLVVGKHVQVKDFRWAKKDPRFHWDSICERLARDGWSLPSTVKENDLLLFDQSGRTRKIVSSQKLTPKHLKRALLATVPDV